jgi:hypothetical protein
MYRVFDALFYLFVSGKLFQCKTCNEEFCTFQALSKHYKLYDHKPRKEPPREKSAEYAKYICDICFKGNYYL